MPSAVARCVLCACALASACHSPPPPPAASSEPQSQPGPALPTEPNAPPPEIAETPEAPVAAPSPSAPDPEEPVTAQFGLPLSPGVYTFPNGLRVRFSAKHECEYDSTDPCSPFDVTAWFQGKEGKANILTGNTKRVVGHSMQVTADQALVVRK